jgi:hypothetical protein
VIRTVTSKIPARVTLDGVSIFSPFKPALAGHVRSETVEDFYVQAS